MFSDRGLRLIVVFLLFFSVKDASAKLFFNPKFLSSNDDSAVDLSRFENGQDVPPGKYFVHIYINDKFVEDMQVLFKEQNGKLYPCFNKKELLRFNIDMDKIKEIKSSECVNFSEIFNEYHFDSGKERLDLSIPQIFLVTEPRGFVSPSFWDDGITSGILNYNYSGSKGISDDNRSETNYLNLGYGINFKGWRFRANSSVSFYDGKDDWDFINTYIEHDIKELKGRVRVGDIASKGTIFDSFSYKGIRLSSVDDMLPDSQRGYAPIIRGVANSTSTVTITQNGYKIYQKTVPQGPFIIDELYASSNGADLKVTIEGSDGNKKIITVPFSSLPILEREGNYSYDINIGEFNSGNNEQSSPKVLESSIAVGLEHDKTIYAGVQLADNYKAINIGVGKNLGILGAFSFDATLAETRLTNDKRYKGVSIRALYNKVFDNSNTNLSLYGYRYSTKGFYTLSDSTYNLMESGENDSHIGFNLNHTRKGRSEINISQPLSEYSSMYLNSYYQSYWNSDKYDAQVQFGINTLLNGINFNLNYNLSESAWFYDRDQSLSLNLSMPLNSWVGSRSKSILRNSVVDYDMTTDMKGSADYQLGLSGTLLKDNNLSYSIRSNYNSIIHSKNENGGGISVNYQSSFGDANLGYSYNGKSKQLYYGARGGVILHKYGITFGRPIHGSAILVRAKDAPGISIDNQTDIFTDLNGLAIIPYATSYRYNKVSLNVKTLPDNIELDETDTRLVPAHDAIVFADFKVRKGIKALFNLKTKRGNIPFGAIVNVLESDISGMVNDNNSVYLVGLPLEGSIEVKWGNEKRCTANFKFDENTNRPVNTKTIECK